MAVVARGDLLELVEATYLVDLPDGEWLSRLAETARPLLDRGFGLSVFEFHRRPDGLPQVLQSRRLGIPPKLEEMYSKVFATMDPEIRKRPFRMGPCVTGSEMMGQKQEFREQPHMKQYAQTVGMFDSLWITAAEPSGWGCGLHSGRPEIAWATRAERETWGRVAGHLSAAVRLRRRLSLSRAAGVTVSPEAVLDPSGKVHEANGEAKQEPARELLKRAVVELERSRGPLRREEPEKALAGWKALVAGRWSLVDHLELDGRRFILARQNEPAGEGPAALTPREKQVVGYAKLGHHNKLIAYELGISDSTVRVLLARAAAKLKVRTRAELLQACPDISPESPGLHANPALPQTQTPATR